MKIVNSGPDRQANHRADFTTCPNCQHEMEDGEWDKASTILVLNPACYKAGSVSVISECPKCFEKSWVHHPMSGFKYSNFPSKIIEAVWKLEASTRLEALRNWGKSICHRCKNLESATVEFHAWRQCIKGSGPAETECEKFKTL